MVQAYQALIDCLNATGIFPLEHILDNECSALFKHQIQLNKMSYQLVPLHNHRRNQAKKGIQTFKDHFVSILCGMDPSFLLHLWDWLLRQAEYILNVLRPARMLKTVSAYTYLYEQHDYNSNPFAPLGCKVEAHVVPEIHETWAPHTASRYYIGYAMEHYHCTMSTSLTQEEQLRLFQAQISHYANFDTIRRINQGCGHPIRSNHRHNTCLKHHK